MEIIKPPHNSYNINNKTIFLAGSIENGKALIWTDNITNFLKESPITFFNPRRDKWNSELEQSINNKEFKEQVDWELFHIEKSDIVIFYFQPGTISPISLLELGICSQMDKQIIVYCPEGYHRKGNVDIICERYNHKFKKIKKVDSFEEIVYLIKNIK